MLLRLTLKDADDKEFRPTMHIGQARRYLKDLPEGLTLVVIQEYTTGRIIPIEKLKLDD